MKMTRGLRDTLFAVVALLSLHSAAIADQPSRQFIELDRVEIRELADATNHKAPTILALWSLECVFCKRVLADLPELHRAHPGIVILTLAAEQAEREHAEVLDALGVPGKRYAYGHELPEALAFALDPDWRGELPRTVFFDGRGGKTAVSGLFDTDRALGLLGLGDGRTGEKQ